MYLVPIDPAQLNYTAAYDLNLLYQRFRSSRTLHIS